MINKKIFRDEVLDHVDQYDVSFIDAIIHVMNSHGLELDDASKVLDNTLKASLRSEGIRMNMIKPDDEADAMDDFDF